MQVVTPVNLKIGNWQDRFFDLSPQSWKDIRKTTRAAASSLSAIAIIFAGLAIKAAIYFSAKPIIACVAVGGLAVTIYLLVAKAKELFQMKDFPKDSVVLNEKAAKLWNEIKDANLKYAEIKSRFKELGIELQQSDYNELLKKDIHTLSYAKFKAKHSLEAVRLLTKTNKDIFIQALVSSCRNLFSLYNEFTAGFPELEMNAKLYESQVLDRAIKDIDNHNNYEAFYLVNEEDGECPHYLDVASPTQKEALKEHFKKEIVKWDRGYIEFSKKYEKELKAFKITLQEIVDLRKEKEDVFIKTKKPTYQEFLELNGSEYIEALSQKISLKNLLLSLNYQELMAAEDVRKTLGISDAVIPELILHHLEVLSYEDFIKKFPIKDLANQPINVRMKVAEKFVNEIPSKLADLKLFYSDTIRDLKITPEQLHLLYVKKEIQRILHEQPFGDPYTPYTDFKEKCGEDVAQQAMQSSEFKEDLKKILFIEWQHALNLNVVTLKRNYKEDIRLFNISDDDLIKNLKDPLIKNVTSVTWLEFFKRHGNEFVEKLVKQVPQIKTNLRKAFMEKPALDPDNTETYLSILGFTKGDLTNRLMNDYHILYYFRFKELYPLKWIEQLNLLNKSEKDIIMREYLREDGIAFEREDKEFFGITDEVHPRLHQQAAAAK